MCQNPVNLREHQRNRGNQYELRNDSCYKVGSAYCLPHQLMCAVNSYEKEQRLSVKNTFALQSLQRNEFKIYILKTAKAELVRVV